MASAAMPLDMASIKARLRQTWNAGDYDRFSRYMEKDASEFYGRLAVPPGSRLLDVACGSGQLALMAAREGIDATGIDIAESLIARARSRAEAEGLAARFEEADAEDLPFEDASFDVVISMIGAMFAPSPDSVARELLRVCAPGGTIAMVNWTGPGFVGQMFKRIARFIAPSGVPSPLLWGDESTVRNRLGSGASALSMTRRHYTFDYPFSPSEVVHLFRKYYGPVNRAFQSLDRTGRKALHEDLTALWTEHNHGDAEFTLVKAEYLEVVAVRR